MTNKEYEQRLEALEREIAALRQETVEDEPSPPHQRPELKQGDKYYYITTDGSILSKSWCNTLRDDNCRAIGNMFRTWDAVEYAAEYYKVLAEMREWSGKWDDPWRILYIDGRVEQETVFVGRCISYGELRFASERDAINCIKAVGEDRLIKYYFGVRDHEIPAETE